MGSGTEVGCPTLVARFDPKIEKTLPEGVYIDTFYDRTELVNLTTHTVRHNLAVGIALVTLILKVILENRLAEK